MGVRCRPGRSRESTLLARMACAPDAILRPAILARTSKRSLVPHRNFPSRPFAAYRARCPHLLFRSTLLAHSRAIRRVRQAGARSGLLHGGVHWLCARQVVFGDVRALRDAHRVGRARWQGRMAISGEKCVRHERCPATAARGSRCRAPFAGSCSQAGRGPSERGFVSTALVAVVGRHPAAAIATVATRRTRVRIELMGSRRVRSPRR